MNHNQKALKAGVWYTVSNFFGRGLGVLITPIIARLLTKAQYGLYSNFTSCLLIASVLVTLNLESSLVSARFDFREQMDEYVFSVLGLSTLSAAVWFVVVNLFSGVFSQLCGLRLAYLNAMLVYLFFSPAVLLFQDRERFRFEYKKTVAASLFVSLGTTVLSVVLAVCAGNRLNGVILGYILPTVVLGAALWFRLAVKGRIIRIRCWKYALPICLPYIPHILSMTMLNTMDKTMITSWCGAEDNAMYSIAYTCGSAVSLLAMSLNSAYSPWLGEKLEQNTPESFREINRFSRVYIAAFFVTAVGIMAVAPEILYILGGRRYLEAKYVLAPISMGCVCQFLYTMFVNVEQYKKKTVGMAVASVAAALVNLVLNCIFIPRLGYLAAAYTTLAGYLCLLLAHMYLVRRMKLDGVYSFRLVLITVVCGIAVMIGMTALYRSNPLRYLFLGIYATAVGAFLIRHRTMVIGVLQSMRK